MLYAKVVFGMPVEGPFDYFLPPDLAGLRQGARVWVNFRNKKKLGYVVKIASQTDIKNTKPILDVIDDAPLLDKNTLLLTKKIADYYCSSWGEAIEAALPGGLRKGRRILDFAPLEKKDASGFKESVYLGRANAGLAETVLICDLQAGQGRWDIYISRIQRAVSLNKSVIAIFSDLDSAIKAKEIIREKLQLNAEVLYRNQPHELKSWMMLRQAGSAIVVGTRSAIFAPLKNLGLIIIDEEESPIYKQEQSPHYHARVAAFLRSKIERANLVLASPSPSLESLKLARENKIRYIMLPFKDDSVQVNIINMKDLPLLDRRQKVILSRNLQDSILVNLGAKAKTLLFLNRKGFATFAFCTSCGKIFKCPRCNINLVYYFHKQILSCHYCNFKISPPKICPDCNSGYIKYSGAGTEKIESELSRIFPQAKILRYEGRLKEEDFNADIFISTQVIVKQTNYKFDLVAVLSIDNSLNYIDFRSAEKTYGLLVRLRLLAKNKMIIQTTLPNHYIFKAVADNNPDIFYEEELKQRRQLGFPPFRHFAFIKFRGRDEEKVKVFSQGIFEKLSGSARQRGLGVISVNPTHPSKLRGNFYWVILICAKNIKAINKFLKINAINLKHSGIIVTIDVDPV